MTTPPEPSLEQKMHMTDSYHKFVHNTSLAMLIVAPALIALPPRKLDFYTFTLGGIFVVSGNQLLRERNGVGVLGLLPGRRAAAVATAEKIPVPEEVVRTDAAVKEIMREGRRKATPIPVLVPTPLPTAAEEGWKERRLKEEQEKLDQGEGYGGMIMDQIWDVWNWGEKKAEGLAEKDRLVLQEKERRRKEELRAREFPIIGKS